MKIGIVGLGLIGGSLALKLKILKHTIYGVTNNKNPPPPAPTNFPPTAPLSIAY